MGTEPVQPRGGGASNRYESLDVWRGLACLMVVVHHAGYALSRAEAAGSWPGWLAWYLLRRMNLGVSLFFVISGYCIAASLVATRRRGETPWSFLGRRVWRIYPPYWVALTGFMALVAVLDHAGYGRYYKGPLGVELDHPHVLDWRQWLGNLTLTETWRPHVWGPERNVFTGVAWSLCFEEQFYLIAFLTMLLVPRRVAGALAVVTGGVLFVRVGAWACDALGGLSGTFPLLWHEFAAGLLVYYRLNLTRVPHERRLAELGLAMVFLAGVCTGGRGTATAGAFGLALVALMPLDGWLASRRWLAFFGACGRRCYSIYLAHLPVGVVGNHWLHECGVTGFWPRVFVMIPLVSAAGVLAGWAFHATIETHFLNAPPWRRASWSASQGARLAESAGSTGA